MREEKEEVLKLRDILFFVVSLKLLNPDFSFFFPFSFTLVVEFIASLGSLVPFLSLSFCLVLFFSLFSFLFLVPLEADSKLFCWFSPAPSKYNIILLM